MSFFSNEDGRVIEAISRLSNCNPFLEERIELERLLLGDAFEPADPVWHAGANLSATHPNVDRIGEHAERLVTRLHGRLVSGESIDNEMERGLYRDLVSYVVYYRHERAFFDRILAPDDRDSDCFEFFRLFREETERLLSSTGIGYPAGHDAAHLFAFFFQVRRAFHYTFRSIAGSSMPAARLRAMVWQSIFTQDPRRYQRSLYDRMGNVTTLITGPSGTGKELVARAIGLSRYVPFDAKSRQFRENYKGSFFPLNLTALSPTLIESELFGHRRGAFTGAVADRRGWLEVCPPLGTVFLDEIGEVDSAIQVKLLRVIETRRFQALGSTEERQFHGKVIAATNRDLGREMQEGRFRADLYYRLCSDIIQAPTLAARLAESPDELSSLIEVLAQRLVGQEEASWLVEQVERWIEAHLEPGYAWPGNVRELAQCVSNVLIRGEYRPVHTGVTIDLRQRMTSAFLQGSLQADQMLSQYCTLVYLQAGSYVEAAERLGLDRRTVKAHVNRRLLEELRGG